MLLVSVGPGLVWGFDGPYGPWQDQDIGSMEAPGSGMYSNGTFRVTASGADICCSADAFHFTYRSWTGDCAFAIRVTGVENANTSVPVDPFARLGIMFRATTSAASPNAYVLWRAGGETAFQDRDSDGSNLWTNGSWVTLPYWVKLVRIGDTFSSYDSDDGRNWTLIDSTNIAMPETFLVGLALTSHDYVTQCVSTCDHLQIEAPPVRPNLTVLRAFNANIISWTEASTNATGFVIQGLRDTNGYWTGGDGYVGAYQTNYVDSYVGYVSYRVKALGSLLNSAFSDPVMAKSGVLDRIPAAWQSADIGGVGVPGSDNYSNGLFRLGGSGAQIGSTNDAFHFVYQKLSGDGDVTGSFWASSDYMSYSGKLGLMFRQSLADDSPFAFVYLAISGMAAEFRAAPGANATTNSTRGGYTVSFRVTRRGTLFTAYHKDELGRAAVLGSQNIQMTDPVYVGMAVTSGDNRYLQLSDFSLEIMPAGGKMGIIRLGDGTLDIFFRGEFNGSYALDASTDLNEWTRVKYQFSGGSGDYEPTTINYFLLPITSLPHHFFRTVLLP
jgi:hypothetical protein